jgi:sugar diacid utilization regulator
VTNTRKMACCRARSTRRSRRSGWPRTGSRDRAHGGDLLDSVRTWLEHDRRTDEAARALHIHPNTLLYRVRRFEQISGRSLASTEGLAETWLALRVVRDAGCRCVTTPGCGACATIGR